MNLANYMRLFNRLPNKTNLKFQLKMNFSTQSSSFVKTIELKTCGQLFKELRKKHPFLYRNSPVNGLDVSVEYVDTLGDNKHKKTILAIHGNPGHHKHFSGLIDYYKDKPDVRVIVPNLPDFRLTRKTMAFWHSNEERVQFIKDFLRAIDVSEIDCLVSHSAGIHPISLFWSEPGEIKIKGVGIFCPQYTRQLFFTRTTQMSFLAKYRFWIALMDKIRPDIRVKDKFPLTFANVDEFLYFLLVHSNIQVSDLHQRMDILKSKQLPTLFVYGENDKLIRKEQYERFYQRLGADFEDVVIYSEDKKLEKDSQTNNWIKVVTIRGGGHFAYSKFSDEVSHHLDQHVLRSKL